jgi:hypothetical protein
MNISLRAILLGSKSGSPYLQMTRAIISYPLLAARRRTSYHFASRAGARGPDGPLRRVTRCIAPQPQGHSHRQGRCSHAGLRRVVRAESGFGCPHPLERRYHPPRSDRPAPDRLPRAAGQSARKAPQKRLIYGTGRADSLKKWNDAAPPNRTSVQ